MTDKINITLDQELLKEIRKEASDRNTSLSSFINSVLSDWVNTRDYIKTSLPEILNGISDIKKYFEELRLNELLNALSGSGTGGPERSDALPEKSQPVKKSTKK